MIKAFLSYSSEDKELVEKVADELGREYTTLDTFSFEVATKTAEEIYKHIEKDKVFVFFISNASLNSEWVKKELDKFYELLKNNKDKKILPIIIDKNIQYKDERIPDWIRNDYNLKQVVKYKKIVNRIKEELIKLNWQINPKQEKIDNLFVGRNDLIKRLEERHRENFYPPLCMIASGFYGIGRKSVLKEYLKKVGVLDNNKVINLIKLEINDSIEDFLIKLNDLGLSSLEIDIQKLNGLDESAKIEHLIEILKDIAYSNEVVFIEDNGCIVLPDGEINSWFKSLLNKSSFKQSMLFVIARYLVKKYLFAENENVYGVNVKELDKKEIRWLLMELIKIKDIEIDEEEFSNLLGLLQGHPEQVLYLVKLLELEGYRKVMEHSYKIVEFNSNRVAYLLEKYSNNIKAKNLLVLLSNFEIIDYQSLKEILNNDINYNKLINEFIVDHLCYELGSNKEYITLSKPVKDVIVRSDWKLEDNIEEKLKNYIKVSLENFDIESKGISRYFYAFKEQLINSPQDINIHKIVPSIVLKAIVTLYDQKKKWKEVIVLGEKILNDGYHVLDEQIENQIRKYLCLAYIREYIKTNNNEYEEKFKQEVQKIKDSSHDFLFGFFYRLTGQYNKALERLKKALERNPKSEKAKREIVQVYLSIFDYNNALSIARENYYSYKQNPYLFQAYMNCMIKTFNENREEKEKEIKKVFEEFKKFVGLSVQAKEMYEMERAKYLSLINPDEAKNKIEEVIDGFPDSIYPKLSMFEIADKLDDLDMLNKAFEYIKKVKNKLPNKYIYEICEIIYKAKNGERDNALLKLNSLKNYPDTTKEALKRRLDL